MRDIGNYLRSLYGIARGKKKCRKVKASTLDKYVTAYNFHKSDVIDKAVKRRLENLMTDKQIDKKTLEAVVTAILDGRSVTGFTLLPTNKVEGNQNATGLTDVGCPKGQTLCTVGLRVDKKSKQHNR